MIKNIWSGTVLNNGVEMPWLGLGVLRLREGGEVEKAVQTALEHGYRLIDNAAIYHNEKGVARGIRASGIPRKDLFLSSKVANDQQGYKGTLKAFQRSLDWLQTEYLDLYLVHWPQGDKTFETWAAMEELYEKGKIRAIGVSNFWIHHLEYFLPKVKITPAINQVEFHPELNQQELLSYCKEKNIQLEAWSPIMQGKVMEIPVIKKIAAKYSKTPVQVTLRWELQKGVITIPRSGKPKEIISNAQIFDFELSDEDMSEIDSLNRNKKIFPYYDRIPFLLKVLLNNQQKLPVATEILKATAYKTHFKLKSMFNHTITPTPQNPNVIIKKIKTNNKNFLK